MAYLEVAEIGSFSYCADQVHQGSLSDGVGWVRSKFKPVDREGLADIRFFPKWPTAEGNR